MPQENVQSLAKAKAFFEKAKAVAQTTNFDYAIDMYLHGLRYSPDALEEGHFPLFELALQRRMHGGKKPSMVERMKHSGGKTPLEQMLNAEFLFVKDPDHLPYAEAMLKATVEGGYHKTAGWIANLVFQKNNGSEKPSAQSYILLKDSYAALGQYDKAVAACQRACQLRPEDKSLEDDYKNLSAELTMARGKYDTEGDFRKAIKDREKQELLQSQDSVIKTEDYRVKAVEDARRKIALNPDLPTNIFALAGALSDLENDQAENDAVSLLENTYKKRNDFSFMQRAGELRMKQLRRKINDVKASLETNPNDAQNKAALEKLTAQLNTTELEHYKRCAKNYPTNLGIRYEYGLRLFRNQQYNEAIPLFQDAQKDPRRKIKAMNYTGLCFFLKGWVTDAIDIFNNAINTYQIKDDATGKELRYNLARAYEENNNAEKALEIYRRIAQQDFGYKDVSQRVDKLRSEKQKPTSQ
ncbi:MAG: tetratricopeptide repeat protein [Phycisphaerales bacterium]|jgi:tetratricopeptide (TPR) repeat protein